MSTPVQTYLDALNALLAAPDPVQGDPEAQLGPLVKGLLESLLEVRAVLEVRTELGRPDLGIKDRGLLVGFVELKAPGKSINPRTFQGHDREQWERFKHLPNLVYTNGYDFALYRLGECVREVRLPGQEALLEELLTDFRHWIPRVPQNPKELAAFLAPIARFLRDTVAEAVRRNPEGPLGRLWQEWRTTLLPEADAGVFADAFAQLMTYGFLLARMNSGAASLEEVLEVLEGRYGLLMEALFVSNHPRLLHEVKPAYDLLRRAIGAVDPAALRSAGGDPWLYFYEDFLAAYDPELRRDMGVYYTPVPVVQAMVRLVDDVLKNKLDRLLGLAHENVTVLDPATGTGTFLLAVLEQAMANVQARWGSVGSYATDLARQLYAFEVMVGPYAVAQLRLSQAIEAYGGQVPEEGLRLYLADTLEAPDAPPLDRPFFYDRLAQERREAARVKREEPILVCLGNPPYDRGRRAEQGHAPGGWVVTGRKDPDDPGSPPLLEDFLRPVRAAGLGTHLKNLYNLYVYFWRWAVWKVFEQNEGPGIVCFITASSYLKGPGFAGMRAHLRRELDALYLLDLGGEGRGAVQEENVFNIQTPVAIALAVRYGPPRREEPAQVFYHRVEGTTREAKLEALKHISKLEDLCFSEAPTGWTDPFVPSIGGDWAEWPLLGDLFPWQSSGMEFQRTWPLGPTQEVLEKRWQKLLQSPDRAEAFRENRDRKVARAYPAILGQGRLEPIASLKPGDKPEAIRRYGYRSFDRAWAVVDGRVCGFPRPALWRSHSEQQLYLVLCPNIALDTGPALSVSAYVPDRHCFFGKYGGKDILPLYRDPACTQPNLTAGLLEKLEDTYRFRPTPEALAAYVYALLAHPGYTGRFSEALRHDRPRLPLTKDPGLFQEAVEMGERLLWLHTYGERYTHVGDFRTFQGTARWKKDPSSYPAAHAYDPNTRTLQVGDGAVEAVAPEAWDSRIGNFYPLRNWLDRRRQNPGGRKSGPLDGIQPPQWSADLSRELLELVWVLEETLKSYPKQEDLLDRILKGPLFTAEELPTPEEWERQPPSEDGEESPVEQAELLQES